MLFFLIDTPVQVQQLQMFVREISEVELERRLTTSSVVPHEDHHEQSLKNVSENADVRNKRQLFEYFKILTRC